MRSKFMDYATTQDTIFNLRTIHQLLAKAENWRQGHAAMEKAARLDEAVQMVCENRAAYQHNLDRNNVFPGDLDRGQIPEHAWFLRQAINSVAPEFGGLIYKWNDAPGRTHEEVMEVISSALELAKRELREILASEDGFDMSGVVLHRWSKRDFSQLCAMTALSQKLGYPIPSDIPREVDPGLSALVNLLNDRANDKTRQLLASRIKHLPNTGRTNICFLIGRVLFPLLIQRYGHFGEDIGPILERDNPQDFAQAYAALCERFLLSDGSSLIATGCTTLAAAFNACDPVQQDLLAVSAASQLVGFETGRDWFDLLQILDFVLGLDDKRFDGESRSRAKNREYFEGRESFPEEVDKPALTGGKKQTPVTKIYEFGIEVRWYPALVKKFPDQLENIAEKILNEITALEGVSVYMHLFPFRDEEIMIVPSWDDDLDILSADADLVAYMDPVGEVDVDGETVSLLRPVPASEAKTIH